MTTRTSRAALAFLLAATLATAALPAASLFEGGASAAARISVLEPSDLLERLLGVVSRWQVKNGCQMDPDGRCLPKRRPVVRKNGCQVDPNGRCLPESQPVLLKNGCSVDPSGHCIPQ